MNPFCSIYFLFEVFIFNNVWNTVDNMSKYLKRQERRPLATTLGFISLIIYRLVFHVFPWIHVLTNFSWHSLWFSIWKLHILGFVIICECPKGEIVLTTVAVCVNSVPTSVTVSENCQTVLTFVAVRIGIWLESFTFDKLLPRCE
jgi:hypothetical protein